MADPLRFLADFARDRAEQVVDTPGGFAALSPRRYPHAHDHNGLFVTGPADPVAVLAAVDGLLAPFAHRQVDDHTLDADFAAAMTAAGYRHEDVEVLTRRRGPDPDRPDGTGVVELTVDQRVDFADRAWADDFAESDRAVSRELAERARGALNAAQCTFLGVVGADGVVEASCDLFVRGDTAQIEEVTTSTPFRGRGHASRLVVAAVDRARADDPTCTVFLCADTDDWPRRLYGRLGFEVTGMRRVWSRAAQ